MRRPPPDLIYTLLDKTSSFAYQDEVGTGKLSVVSVALWDEVAAAITPDFSLTVAAALDRVGLSVRAEDEAYLQQFTAALQISLPSSTTPQTGAPSVAKALEPPKLGDLPALSEVKGTLGTPKSTVSESGRFRLGLALYQEVQLLNSYIKQVNRDQGWKAYLASMDVALLPARRAEVDAQVMISFVPKLEDVPSSSPTVIPIVVSDDIEINQHSRQVKDVVQLMLSLVGNVYGVQGAAELGRINEELLRAVGRDINTLQVVASASPNALVVRFGASYGVETRYALYSQTRRVHALLLVPPDFKGNELFAVTNVVFTRTDGSQIPGRDYADVLERNTKEINARLGVQPGNLLKKEDVDELWTHYHQADMVKFIGVLTRKVPKDRFHAAWTEMARLSARTPWSYAKIVLPETREQEFDEIELIIPPAERYAALDDGKMIRSHVPGRGLSLEPGRWKLRVANGGTVAHLLPVSVSRVSDRLVEVKFPSPADRSKTPQLSLVYRHFRSTKTTTLDLVRVEVSPLPTPKPAIRMLTDPIIAGPDGTGEMVLEVGSEAARSLTLEGTPAVLVGEAGKTVTSIALSGGAKRVVVPLRHLAAGRTVTIVVWGSKDEELGRVSAPVIDSGSQPSRQATKDRPGASP